MKFFLRLLFASLVAQSAFAQDSSIVKTNPIIYGAFNIGGAFAGHNGLQLGAEGNYQLNDHHLFTVRFTSISDFSVGVVSPFVPFPIINVKATIKEKALLYGYRKIDDWNSFSFSAGISLSSRTLISQISSNKSKH